MECSRRQEWSICKNIKLGINIMECSTRPELSTNKNIKLERN